MDWGCVTAGLQPRAYKRHAVVFPQSRPFEYVYICQSGRIQVSLYSKDGGSRILFICDSNTLFGEIALFDPEDYDCSAVCATDCFVYSIPAQKFFAELQKNHQLAMNVMITQARKVRLLSTIVKQLSFSNATYRVAYALVNLVNKYSTEFSGQTYKLTLKYTHQDLADLTGLSRVSVSNVLTKFQAMSILEKDRKDGYTVIKNPEKLYQFLEHNI
jgi:CRP/FNR family transcriptional regulator